MARLTVDDLKKIKEQNADRINFKDKTYLLICGGTNLDGIFTHTC